MIIELERYNVIRKLLIGIGTTGFAGTHMLLGWSMENICNYSSCPHRGGGDGDVNRNRSTSIGLQVGNEGRYNQPLWSNQRSISMQ